MAAERRSPTINDVAELAGVSKSLVSLVVRNSPNVSDKRRAAVLKAAEELRYRPNAVARSLVRQRTYVLGCVISDMHNPFFSDMADGIEEEAVARGYRALFAASFLDESRENIATETLLQLRVDGLIVAGPVAGGEGFEAPAGLVPTVLAASPSMSESLDTIANDDELGARSVVDHLVELGHERITHIHGSTGAVASRRRDGYIQAMNSHSLQHQVRMVGGAYTEGGGESAMREILNDGEPPTAVFAPNDFAAFGAIDVIDAAGLRVPGDISIVGYDDNQFARHGRFALTTVRQPSSEIGAQSVRLLVERIEENRLTAKHILLPPELVVRKTTGPPRA